MTNYKMTNAIDMIMDEAYDDQINSIAQVILHETIEEKIIKNISDVSYLQYLMKFEQYTNNHDFALFGKEWDNAEIDLSKVKIDKFWVTIYLTVDAKTDLRAVKRIMNDKESQNQVKYKKLDDGRIMLKFKILKRYLDQIERDDKEKAEEIADREIQS